MPLAEPIQTIPATLPAKRPYAPPALVVHGDVQTLTKKTGTELDQEGGGSFIPDGTN